MDSVSLSPDHQIAAILEAIRGQYVLDWNGLHGIGHWARVYENGLRISGELAVDPSILLLFSLFHDACRVNDHVDPGHGKRGADLAARYRGRHFELADDKFDLLYYACEAHTDGLTEADLVVQVCWDADRLDLLRVGIAPTPERLCTAAARDPSVVAWASRRARDHFLPMVFGARENNAGVTALVFD